MYAFINGTVDEIGTDYAVIETGGVGYMLFCSKYTLDQLNLGSVHKLYVHMAVSQDNVALYGFSDTDERAMFRELISVSRIGSKIALATLSKLSVSDVAMAITTGNSAAFDPVPGMGRKTAERVILELKGKITPTQSVTRDNSRDSAPRAFDMRSEAIEALMALGYDGLSAGRAVGAVEDSEYKTVQELIKLSLAKISERGLK